MSASLERGAERQHPPQPVRRSTRIRQRTSPYFKVKTDESKERRATPGNRKPRTCSRKPSTSNSDRARDAKGQEREKRQTKVKRKTPSNPKRGTLSGEEAGSPPGAEAERVHGLARQVNFYGLIQEIVTPNVFRLLVATCLLNQTKGRAAMPVFWELLRRWPDEHSLAKADVAELTELLQPIGLHNIRAKRLINMAQTMVEVPYDERNSFKSRDRTAPGTPIGIYPGVGRYAIDSWRIFVAGGGASVGLQGDKPVSPFDTATTRVPVSKDEVVDLPLIPPKAVQAPEWKSVMPLDKELRAYLIWRWAKEGQVWDPLRGIVSTSSPPH